MILIRNIKKKNANRFIINQLAFYVVDYTGKISNFLDDLEKLDRFAQSVEDELNRIVSAGEGSRKDP